MSRDAGNPVSAYAAGCEVAESNSILLTAANWRPAQIALGRAHHSEWVAEATRSSRLLDFLIKDEKTRFREIGAEFYETNAKERLSRQLLKRLGKLGDSVSIQAA